MGMPSYIPVFLAMVMALAGGGPNDLLGYLSSDAYWKAKNVQPTVAQLTADLAQTPPADVSKLIGALSAPDPAAREEAGKKIAAMGPGVLRQLDEAAKDPDAEIAARSKALAAQVRAAAKGLSVRRLMAIRTLGEMKSQEAVPALQGLVDSKEQFVSDYAKAAIASIEGKPAAPASQPAADRLADVKLLPAKIDMVCQLAPGGGPVLPLEKVFGRLPLALPNEDPVRVLGRINASFVHVVDAIGNVRLDTITLGWYTAPVGKPGHAILIARGEFDLAAIVAVLQRNQVPQKAVGNTDVYFLDESTALLFPSEGTAVLIAAEKLGEMPIDETLAALNKGPAADVQNAELGKLIASIDTKQPLWMVTKVRDLRDMFDFLSAFDTVTLVAKARPGAQQPAAEVSLTGNGTDAQTVKTGIDTAQAELKQGADETENEAKVLPMLKPVADMARSIKVKADGKSATATGKVTLDAVLPYVVNSGVRIDVDAK